MKLIKLDSDPIEKVYAGLAAEEVEKVKRYKAPPRRFRASEISQCRRRIWYRLAGFRPTPDEPWLRLVAESGGMYHDYTRYIMNHFGVGLTGFSIDEQTGAQKEDKYIVRAFTYDGRTFDLVAQADAGIGLDEIGKAAVEIKSMSFFDFDEVNRAFIKDGEEAVMEKLVEKHINYIWQGNATAMIQEVNHVYLVLVGRSGNNLGLADVPQARQGDWNPTRGRRRAGIVWELEQADRENILQKLADIDRALEQGDPPAPDFLDGSRDCNQCPFWRLCHGAKKGAKYPVPGVE